MHMVAKDDVAKKPGNLVNWAQCRRLLESEVRTRHPSWKFTCVQKDDIMAHLENVLRDAIWKLAGKQAHIGKTVSMRNAGYVPVEDAKNGE